MKIVVTNWSGLASSHIEKLKQWGEVELFTDTTPDNYAERVAGAEIVVIDCFLTPVTDDLLAKSPDLKYFTINSTGYDKVDLNAVKEAGVVASHVPSFSTDSVAELAIGLMFATVRRIVAGDKDFRNGLYEVDPGTEQMDKYQGFNLVGKTLGVAGLGNIGSRVAEIGKGLGMEVIAYNRSIKNVSGVKMVSLEKVMKESDVVVVTLALTEETSGLISRELIGGMKPTSHVISIAGMPIFDQDALKEALNNGSIAGAGLDDTADGSFVGVKNTVLTPHIGYDSKESIENMSDTIVDNIKGYVSGSPINIIS